MTELSDTNGFMESVPQTSHRSGNTQRQASDYRRKLAGLLNLTSGIWAVVYIKIKM